HLVVLPALPASLVASLVPERTLYAVDEQVTLVAEATDEFGNRVDYVDLAYSSLPTVPAPAEARFRFDADGTFTLRADVTSSTFMNVPLSAEKTVFVDTGGPTIECMR